MCQASGRLEISYQDTSGYIRSWVGRTGFNIPPKAHAGTGIRHRALGLIHQQVDFEIVRGILIKIERR